MSWLRPVTDALDAIAGPVPVFLRDDDAGWADARLLALLDVLAAAGVPVDVAVIPCALGAPLARELAGRERVSLHQHGYAHANHEREGRKHEFGPGRPVALQRADLAAGRQRLAARLGDRVEPIFTPPWNRCTAATGACLLELGFRVLSRESRALPLGLAGLRELPVHADFVRLDRDELGRRLAGAIRAGGPVGVMLHHEEMDGAALRRLGELARVVAQHPGARPATMMELAASAVA
jgi:peptidoglycan/xylan/chitin deacetylase (PgdA/CDA1 family)